MEDTFLDDFTATNNQKRTSSRLSRIFRSPPILLLTFVALCLATVNVAISKKRDESVFRTQVSSYLKHKNIINSASQPNNSFFAFRSFQAMRIELLTMFVLSSKVIY